MIKNLPPEFRDLEIHIQQLLTDVAELKKNSGGGVSTALDSRLSLVENNYISKAQQFPLGYDTVARYSVSTTQNIADNDDIFVRFLTDRTLSPYLTSNSNQDEFTVVESGIYIITCGLLFNGIASNYQHIETRILINGSRFKRGRLIVQTDSDNTNSSSVEATLMEFLNEGDKIRIEAYQNNFDNLSRSINTTGSFSNLNIVYIGKNGE